MARFIHTADWHIGKPFGWVGDAEVRGRLKEARHKAVGRIGDKVKEHGAEVVLVAGDLFDSNTVVTSELLRVLSAIGRIGVRVIVIPGNHDNGGKGSVYQRADFESMRQKHAPNLEVALEPGPIDAAGVRILACPLVQRRTKEDPTAWIKRSDSWAEGWSGPVVVLAHGSVVDFGLRVEADSETEKSTPNLIDVKALEAAGVDYVALGDWHGQKKVGKRSWYSGSPEPTRFGEESGKALLVEVTGRGQAPSVKEIDTGEIGWHGESVDLSADQRLTQLGELERRLMERPGDNVLRLELSGMLGLEARAKLDQKIGELRSLVMTSSILDQARLRPSNEEIARLLQRPGLVGIAARKVEAKAAGKGGEGEVVSLALLKLYEALEAAGDENGKVRP
ncbi:MAG: DNA repair exonuclease [Polyangia bacterium]|jgi:DNA repair exonuclease SbcCD nuclease subunit|nr:DNA repair exonuclease [Polyangia bacterium]